MPETIQPEAACGGAPAEVARPEPTPASAGEMPAEKPGVTPASVILGVGIALALAWYDSYFMEKSITHPQPSYGYLPMVPVMVMLLLILANVPLRLLSRVTGLACHMGRKQLLVVLAIVLVTEGSLGGWQFLVGLLPSPYYYASPENDLGMHILSHHAQCDHLFPFRPGYRENRECEETQMDLLYKGLPKDDPSGIPWYNRSVPLAGIQGTVKAADLRGDLYGASRLKRYLPHSQPKRKAIWQVWLGPLFWWGALFLLGFFVQFCMMSILRKQWLENEKLMFPQIEPVRSVAQYADEGGASLLPAISRSGGFWAGFGVSAFLLFFDGLSHYLPAVPSFNLGALSLSGFLTEKPWDSIPPEISIQPYMVAVAFFLTAEMSFSIWFFAMLDNLTRIITTAGALPPDLYEALNSYQHNSGADATGAILVFVAMILWAARGHLKGLLRGLLPREGAPDGSSGGAAVVGFVAGTLLILAWCRLAGMSWWVSLMLFGVWYVILVFVARLVCEVGVLGAGTGYFNPPNFVVTTLGFNHARMASTFTVNVFIWPTLFGGYGGSLLAFLMQASKATEGVRRSRVLMAVIFLSIIAALGISSYRILEYAYRVGALNSPAGSFREVHWVFNNTYVRDVVLKDRAHSPDWGAEIPMMILGAAVMAFLLAMRHLFYWWPLHPVGYVAMGVSGGIWFSFFLGWLIKRAVLRYGGGGLLKKVSPAFVGLFTGQFFAAGSWFLVDLVLKATGLAS